MRTRRPLCSSISEIEDSSSASSSSSSRASFEELGIDLVDDLHVARQQPLEQRHRPAFQRLGQQRVVGVGDACRW